MSSKLPSVNSRQLIRALRRAGFEERRQRGSHLHLHRDSEGRSIPTGTLRAILRDADVSVEEFHDLL